MALTPRATVPLPDVWSFFSHSYGDGLAGSYDQTGRMDAIFRQRLDCEYTNWNKYSVAGSRILVEGSAQGGWGTLWRYTSGGKMPNKTYPYTGQGGALVIVHGINDLGSLGGASTQILAAELIAFRAIISRWRAAFYAENDTATGNLQATYGGTWTAETGKTDFASSGTERFHSTTGGTVTITLPADYKGEPVVMNFIGRPGSNGGTVTFSGTAGVTGTISTDNIMPSATLSNIPVVKRVTNLTSSNASQTIIATVTANVGLVYYDCAWLESLSPPPVIIANIPRLPSGQYTVKYPSWTAQQGSFDLDVAAWNANLATVVAEFDGMVQVADLDGKLQADATKFSDGLHPNDLGAGLCADALYEACQRLSPKGTYGLAAQFNTPARKASSPRLPVRSALWYTTQFDTVATATAPTAGDMYAYPFYVTEGNTRWVNWGMEVIAAGTGASANLRFGMYNDLNVEGYPNTIMQEITIAGVLTINTAGGLGLKSSTGGSYQWAPDPGLYWLVFKYDAVTAGSPAATHATMAGPALGMPQVQSTGLIGAGASGRPVGWKLTGQTAGALPSAFPTGAVLTNTGPYFGLQRST
jgi:hypothetical protein